MDVFEQAFDIVVGHEGGYDRTEADPGNWTGGRVGAGTLAGTKFGISAASYPDVPIASLTLADAQGIYRRDYWDPIGADRLQPPLALLIFDAAVNNGRSRAVRWLQAIVATDADGIVGEHTLDATAAYVAANSVTALCAEFLAHRLAFMADLPTWRIFGMGWARRLCALPYQSLTLGST